LEGLAECRRFEGPTSQTPIASRLLADATGIGCETAHRPAFTIRALRTADLFCKTFLVGEHPEAQAVAEPQHPQAGGALGEVARVTIG